MILNLKDLFSAKSKSITFDYKMDLCSYQAPNNEYPFKEPIKLSGSVINRADVVILSAAADFNFYTCCDRCLKDIVIPVSVPFENVLVIAFTGDGNDDFIICENEMIDIDEIATTNIVLSLSMKYLCKEDCKGLCPTCGMDLNESDCGCNKGYINPSFAALKDIIK